MTRHKAKLLGLWWCIAVSIGAALGGVWGIVTWPDDREV